MIIVDKTTACSEEIDKIKMTNGTILCHDHVKRIKNKFGMPEYFDLVKEFISLDQFIKINHEMIKAVPRAAKIKKDLTRLVENSNKLMVAISGLTPLIKNKINDIHQDIYENNSCIDITTSTQRTEFHLRSFTNIIKSISDEMDDVETQLTSYIKPVMDFFSQPHVATIKVYLNLHVPFCSINSTSGLNIHLMLNTSVSGKMQNCPTPAIIYSSSNDIKQLIINAHGIVKIIQLQELEQIPGFDQNLFNKFILQQKTLGINKVFLRNGDPMLDWIISVGGHTFIDKLTDVLEDDLRTLVEACILFNNLCNDKGRECNALAKNFMIKLMSIYERGTVQWYNLYLITVVDSVANLPDLSQKYEQLAILVKYRDNIYFYGKKEDNSLGYTQLDVCKLTSIFEKFPASDQLITLEVKEVPQEVYEEIILKNGHAKPPQKTVTLVYNKNKEPKYCGEFFYFVWRCVLYFKPSTSDSRAKDLIYWLKFLNNLGAIGECIKGSLKIYKKIKILTQQ